MKKIVFCLVLSLFSALAAIGDKDADAILKSSDRARGGGLPGISWQVKVLSVENGKKQESTLTVKANADDSLVEYTAPPRVSGEKLLMNGKTMYFSQPGLQRPVPISPRQKLSGQAANGDIAATNYAVDYTPTFDREEACGKEQCAVLRLKAAKKGVTYDEITYWISLSRKVGVKAEFYSVSGKLFKSATFDYNNQLSYKGSQFPFVSRMIISDAVNAENITTLEYSSVRIASLSPADFNVDLLVR